MATLFKCNGENLDSSLVIKAVLSRSNAAVDILKLELSRSCGALSAGASIEVFEGSVRLFCGTVGKCQNALSAGSRVRRVEVRGPWDDLERIVFQQLWKRYGGDSENGPDYAVLEPVMRSKVILGQDGEGGKISAGEQILDILSYAISCGANFAVGEISVPSDMLMDEAKDLSCAEALLRVLKWSPNNCVFFDYSAIGAPVLNILPRSSLPLAEIDANSGDIKDVFATPRPDLAASCVAVKYESRHSSDKFTWLTVDEDIYPQGANSASKNAVVMSVELSGLKESSQVYEIECETIRESSLQWWRDKLGDIIGDSEITIRNVSRKYSSLPRELVSGSIVSDMNFQAQREVVSAEVEYVDENESAITKTFSVRTIATNATSGSYHVWNVSQIAEPKPEGLARAIYEAVIGMNYEGHFTQISPSERFGLGWRIRILNTGEDFSDMDSCAVSSEEDFLKSTFRVSFGPPKHLYADNIAELFRINRNRTAPDDYQMRSTGKSATASISISGLSPDTSSSSGDAKYSRFVISGEDGSSVDIDSAELGEDKKASFRELHFIYDGRLARAKFLMSDPEIDWI